MQGKAILLVALAGTIGVGAPPSWAQQAVSEPTGITVIAPRQRERSPTTGAPIETVSTSVIVNYSDLDLRTKAGQDELTDRVEKAARKACDWLDQLYPVTAQGGPDCMATARNSAENQVGEAIAAARGAG